MDDVEPSSLSFEVRAKLAELEIELSEGDITEKGYQKKKAKILDDYFAAKNIASDPQAGGATTSHCPILPSGAIKLPGLSDLRPSPPSNQLCYQNSASSTGSDLQVTQNQSSNSPSNDLTRRQSGRRYARDDVRYRSDIREEAVKEALRNDPDLRPEALRPSRRTYVNRMSGTPEPGPSNLPDTSEPPSFPGETNGSCSSNQTEVPSNPPPPPPSQNSLPRTDVFHKISDPLPLKNFSDPHHLGNILGSSKPASSAENLQTDQRALTSVLSASAAQLSRPEHEVCGPSTSSDSFCRNSEVTSPIMSNQPSGTVSRQMSTCGLVCPTRVSEKIQQLVNTLQRPKRRPLPEYFIDEDDQVLVQPVQDPNAPCPRGAPTEPLLGEKLVVPSGLPRNIESALQRYAGLIGKTPALTCMDISGRSVLVLTYAKLLQRSTRIAFLLLNKLGHRGELSLKPRDRVALVYTSNDPVSFLVAFYGCLLASVLPIAIEVPSSRKDGASQDMGFLLSSQDARVVLTNEQVYKSLQRTASGDVAPLPGWPAVTWINTDHHGSGGRKPPKDWVLPERLPPDETMYIEYTYTKDGSVHGVMNSRKATLAHCRALTAACHYSEEDVMVCVVDCRREAGLWHAALTSVFNGMHVVFVPYNVLQVDPGSWIRMTTKYRASVAIVKSRDLHWAVLADREHSYANLSSLRAIFVTDGHNPWSLNSCDLFAEKFKSRGLNPGVICPIAGSSETLTLSLRRPIQTVVSSTSMYINTNGNAHITTGNGVAAASVGQANNAAASAASAASARGIISIHSLSYGVIRVDTEDSFTSLTLQDCGQVLPGATMVVVSLGPKPVICRTDEVGELCIAADYTGAGYWGLRGQTGTHFHVQPVHADGRPVGPPNAQFVRSGLIGFPGPASSGGLIFICGSIEGLLTVANRRHNANDIIATVIAVQPTKIVYRGRIAVFSIEMLKDERIVVVAELRNGFPEETAFSWMSQVLQAVDSIHQVSLYALALVPQNSLPRTPFGGINIHEVRRLFSEGYLNPLMLLLCPHSAIQNLPQPRSLPPMNLVGPSAMMVGQVVQGARLAEAHGRSIATNTSGSMTALGPGAPDLTLQTVTDVLLWRVAHTPDDRLFSVYNAKGAVVSSLTCVQLHRRAERLGSLLLEKGNVTPGAVVALIYPPGIEMVCAFYACLYIAAVPVLVRPPQPGTSSAPPPPTPASLLSSNFFGGSNTELSASSNSLAPPPLPAQVGLEDSLKTAWNVVSSAGAVVCLTQASVIKVIRSKEATNYINFSKWPPLLDTEENWRKKLSTIHQPTSPETEVAYLDFIASTTGTLTGVEITHAAASALCRAQKMQCEFYPARELVLCLEPYSGLAASLWLLTSIFCGHHSILVPPQVTEAAPDLWLTVCSQRRVREAFCSYPIIKITTTHAAKILPTLKASFMKEVTLDSLRSLVIVAEERPRVSLTSLFTKLFAGLNLSPRAVSTSFGCRTNLAMCLQGASSPDITTVYVDRVSLRNDRVNLLEKGSPNSLCLMESGKLLPGVHVAIANPETFGQCADSHLGEIWVSSPHNSTRLLGPFNVSSSGDSLSRPSDPVLGVNENAPVDPLKARFVTGDTDRVYARTSFLGFVRRTELTQSDGAFHDAVFVVGNLEETMVLRGMRFYPMDIENTVLRSHKLIQECAVFTWSNLLVVVVELVGEESDALNLVHPVTASVLREHQLIVGVVVVTDRGTVRIDLHGEKQRILLRDSFVNDKLDPIYVSYNM
ncbi:beta transducin [Sparganum proliferum]